MSDTAQWQWRQVDEYYWVGPPGWTICKIFTQGQWWHELWQLGEGHRIPRDRAVSLEGAKKRHRDLELAGQLGT